MFDFKKVTGQLFEFGTPDFFKEWIKKLVDKVETVEHEKKFFNKKLMNSMLKSVVSKVSRLNQFSRPLTKLLILIKKISLPQIPAKKRNLIQEKANLVERKKILL